MDDAELVVSTRKALHAVAELLLAGPQYRECGEIALAVTDRGFASLHRVAAGVERIEVTAAGVISEPAGGVSELRGSVRELATALGVTPGAPENLYAEHAELGPDDELAVDPGAVDVILRAFVDGATALRTLEPGEQPILWPEHFDVGTNADEVNYGVSPGDAAHHLPYAYVGPWSRPEGPFWNETFGASRPVHELGGADGILEFFRAGRHQARHRSGATKP